MEDYYTFYVLLLGLSEEIFWNADLGFLRGVAENKAAFDNYINVKTDEYYEKLNRR